MKRTRKIFYLGILLLIGISYYLIIDALYVASSDSFGGKKLVAQLVATINLPVVLILGFIRWLVIKSVVPRQLLLDLSYFILPVAAGMACLSVWIWGGIILSALALLLIGYEFFKNLLN